MIFVDTSALIAILVEEPEATIFAEKIQTDPERISGAHVILESSMRFASLSGLSPRAADDLVTRALHESSIAIVPITEEVAHAAVVAFERYGKGRGKAKLNFGDCLSYACAKVHGARLLFKGGDFVHTDIARA